MTILLRKVRGIAGLTPVLRTAGGQSFGIGAPPSSVFAFLTSPWMLALLALAFLVAWFLVVPAAGDSSPLMGFTGLVGADAIKELHEKRRKAIADARVVNDKATAEKRDLNADEQKQFDGFMSEAQGLQNRVERELKLVEEERKLAEKKEEERQPDPTEQRKAPENERPERRAARVMAEVRAMDALKYAALPQIRAVGAWFQDGPVAMSEAERRALEVTNSASGGYLQPPQEFIARLIAAVDNETHIRQMATKYALPKAESIGVPSRDNDPADPTWVGELSVGSEDSTMSFGKRELRPHPLAQFIKVSNTLMRKAALDVEAEVRSRLAYKMGIVQENGFLNGNGAAQPLGVFTASTNGISTGRDVSTGNLSTSIQYDGLIEAKFTLKAQYWPRATWLFHRDAVKQITKLKDGDGQYLWRESVRVGEPSTLLGLPFRVSEYAPNTFTTGLYVGILGDFSNYWIADALDMQLQRLVEKYADTNQTGFIVRSETDGMPVLEEAFVRVKLG